MGTRGGRGAVGGIVAGFSNLSPEIVPHRVHT